MRKGEIARLMWEDVDLKDGYLIVKESKNGESRTIPLHSRLFSTLLELKDKTENPYVFTTPEVTPTFQILHGKERFTQP